jgi:hypothetical protein
LKAPALSCRLFLLPVNSYASDPPIDEISWICNAGEVSLCHSGGDALFVIVCLRRTLESRDDKIPAAARIVAVNGSRSRMSSGDRGIQITFEECTHGKSKRMAPGPSTGDAIGRNIPITFNATPPLSGNAKRNGERADLPG